jgi:drug/metabolite transporter (DMT)-like permease
LGAAFTFLGVAFLALGLEPTFLAEGDFLAAAGFLVADYSIWQKRI